mgnify:CR=1 FL=1
MKYKEAINLIEKNVYNFKDLPIKFREDKNVALKAVKTDGYSLQYVCNKLKEDKNDRFWILLTYIPWRE